jgi:hypothetical protein
MLPATTERVRLNTAQHVNDQIRQQTQDNISRASAGGRSGIDRRLDELDREWDIERTLEANAASIVLIGTALSAFVDRRFLVIPAVVGTFLLQHALQGWCPPVPLFRRVGVRTESEINEERDALKALRGDFARVATGSANANQALAAARR